MVGQGRRLLQALGVQPPIPKSAVSSRAVRNNDNYCRSRVVRPMNQLGMIDEDGSGLRKMDDDQRTVSSFAPSELAITSTKWKDTYLSRKANAQKENKVSQKSLPRRSNQTVPAASPSILARELHRSTIPASTVQDNALSPIEKSQSKSADRVKQWLFKYHEDVNDSNEEVRHNQISSPSKGQNFRTVLLDGTMSEDRSEVAHVSPANQKEKSAPHLHSATEVERPSEEPNTTPEAVAPNEGRIVVVCITPASQPKSALQLPSALWSQTQPEEVEKSCHTTPNEIGTGISLPVHRQIQESSISVTPPDEDLSASSKQGLNVRKNLFPEGSNNTGCNQLSYFASPELSLDEAIGAWEEPAILVEEVLVSADTVQENASSTIMVSAPTDSLSFDGDAETADDSAIPNRTQDVTKPKRKRRTTSNDKTPPKKRKLDGAKWKAAEAKLAYNSGLPHISLRGKEIRGRAMKEGCGQSCKKKCQTNFTPEKRQLLFQKYWDLKDKSVQWFLIAKLVRIVDIKRRKAVVEDGDEPYRKHSYEYHLEDPTSLVQVPVCQTMFLHTYDISISVVKTALAKNSPDKRGKHNNRVRLSPILVEGVKDHIKRFPVIESHYCRALTRRKYLDENLNIAKMYRLYKMGREKDMPFTASLRQYRDIFNTCFNLGFFKPKKDQCSLCLDWQALRDEQKTPAKTEEYNKHHQAKQIVRDLRKADKALSRDKEASAASGSNIRVLTFDLQKVLYCPKGENGEFFYKRKLSCYNFTIFDCTLKQAVCYVWDATTGKRGSDEITSFLLNYFEELVQLGVNDIRCYSDSCAGQNKNQFLFSMYQMASAKFNIKITHRWLEKGHTQMECDSVHALIEKKTRNLQIYVPAQWYGSIKSAKVQKPAYIVKEVKVGEILSFKSLASHFTWSAVPISKLRELIVDSSSPGIAVYKKEFQDEATKQRVLTAKRGRPVNLKTFKLNAAYAGRLQLKPKILADLKWYVKKGFVPDAHLPFYNSLFEPPAGEQLVVPETEEDEDDIPQEVPSNVEFFEDVPQESEIDDNEPPLDNLGNVMPPVSDDDNASIDSEVYD